MTKHLTILVVMSFAGIAMFGFLAMGDHGPGHDFSGCIAAFQKEADCSVSGGLVRFATFHLDVLKTFSLADLSAAAASATFLFAAILMLAILPRGMLNGGTDRKQLTTVAAYQFNYDLRTSFERKLMSWFALHEMRDAAFLS